MSDQLLVYNGVAVPGGTTSRANSYVKQGADQSINVGPVNTTQVNTSGPVLLAATAMSATGTFTGATSILRIDATAGDVTATLPPSATVAGQYLVVKRTDSSGNTCTLSGAGGTENIDASATLALSALAHAVLFANGTGWDIVG